MPFSDLIGNTPLIELSALRGYLELSAHLFAKAEFMNPTGSVKDRSALFMIRSALEKGVLSKDGTVVEISAGNSAISAAAVCAAFSLDCVIVLPDDTDKERINTIREYGAKIITVPGKEGRQGLESAAKSLFGRVKNAVLFDPFASDDNAEAHRQGTAQEILNELPQVDALVCGIGTGGTVTGCGEIIKRMNPECHIVGVEPAESPVISGGNPGTHGISGIGAGFVPEVLNTYILNEMLRVRTPDALEGRRILAQTEGILCGVSSGAALVAAVSVARRAEFSGKNIVLILPDR